MGIPEDMSSKEDLQNKEERRMVFIGNLPRIGKDTIFYFDESNNEVVDKTSKDDPSGDNSDDPEVMFRKLLESKCNGLIKYILEDAVSGHFSYAIVEFEKEENAAAAIEALNFYHFELNGTHLSRRLRVEFVHVGVDDRKPYRVIVECSKIVTRPDGSFTELEELKNHMRQAGDVCYGQIFKCQATGNITSVIDYAQEADMQYAIDHLHDSHFPHDPDGSLLSVSEYSLQH